MEPLTAVKATQIVGKHLLKRRQQKKQAELNSNSFNTGPEDGPVTPDRKSHKTLYTRLGAVAAVGLVAAVLVPNVGRIEGAIIGDAAANTGKAAGQALKGFAGQLPKIHAPTFRPDRNPVNGSAGVEQSTASPIVQIDISGGNIKQYVGVTASHKHPTGGESLNKAYLTNTIVGGSVTVPYKKVYGLDGVTLVGVDATVPRPGVQSEGIESTDVSYYAHLRQGDSLATIAKKIVAYEAKPEADSGITYHKSGWYLDLTGSVDNGDKLVQSTATTAVDLSLIYDGFNPFSPTSVNVINSYWKAANLYTTAQIEKDFPALPAADIHVTDEPQPANYLQVIEGRVQAEAPQLEKLGGNAYFSSTKKDQLEFTLSIPSKPNPVNADVVFADQTADPSTATYINQVLGLHTGNAK